MKRIRRQYVPCPPGKIAELEATGPAGWKFLRATHTSTEHGDVGVRIFFARRPVEPPTPEPRDGDGTAVFQSFGSPMKSARFLCGRAGVEVTLEDGSTRQIPQKIADLLFAYRPERRPTLRLRTPAQWRALKDDPAPIFDAVAGTSFRYSDVVIDVLLRGEEARAFFGLGANVLIESIRGDWEGESIVGRGVCRGFAVRCVEA